MKLYFVRHGQSEQNQAGIHQGTDAKLSDIGKKQSRVLAARLKNKNIDIVFSSPFPRAKETADIISRVLKRKVEIREELKEVVWPSEIIGLHHTDPKSIRIRRKILDNVHDPDYRYSDEENFKELKSRASMFIEHLLKEHKDQNILCVSHGLIQKVFVGVILFEEEFNSKIYYKFRANSWMENTGITEIDYSDEEGWILQTWNDKTHL